MPYKILDNSELFILRSGVYKSLEDIFNELEVAGWELVSSTDRLSIWHFEPEKPRKVKVPKESKKDDKPIAAEGPKPSQSGSSRPGTLRLPS